MAGFRRFCSQDVPLTRVPTRVGGGVGLLVHVGRYFAWCKNRNTNRKRWWLSTDAYRPRVSCHLETINVTTDSPVRYVACSSYLSPAVLRQRPGGGLKFNLPFPFPLPPKTLSSANKPEGSCLPCIAVHTVPNNGLCSLWNLNARKCFSMVENWSWRLFLKSV
jgi:hypothetical protein